MPKKPIVDKPKGKRRSNYVPVNPNGRDKIDVENHLNFWEVLGKLCMMQCTQEEIQMVMNLDIDTISSRCKERFSKSFSDVHRVLMAEGRSSLRRVMWKKALRDEHTGMQIWLSKQHLGMKEKVEETFNGKPFIIEGFLGEKFSMGIGESNPDGEVQES
jgi:hypothetical protein